MRLLETSRWLMGKLTAPSNLGERIAAGFGLLLMTVGFWAVWMNAFVPNERHIPASWWMDRVGELFILSLIASIAHKVFIIKGTFVSPLGLTGVLAMMVVVIGQPLAMAAASHSFRPLLSSSFYEWMAISGLVVGSVYVDLFTWMYERMRQEETERHPPHRLERG